MENPKDLRYSKEHEWVKGDGDTVTVGITDHAQHELTDIVFVELPKVGDKVESGKPMGVVESVKSVSDIICPVNGEVVEVNAELENSPELINKEPFDSGWICKIKLTDTAQLDSLMTADRYDELIGKN